MDVVLLVRLLLEVLVPQPLKAINQMVIHHFQGGFSALMLIWC